MFTHKGTPLPDHKHNTIAEARACEFALRNPAPAPAVVDSATPSQLSYIRDLRERKGLQPLTFNGTRRQASLEIARLQSMPDKLNEADEKQRQMLEMIEALMPEDGYYCVLPPGTDKHHFLRIKRPKSTSKDQFAGGLKVQTQHSDDLDLALGKRADGVWTVRKPYVIELLKLVVVNPDEAGILYSEKIGRCMRCNKELTDERSRYYGIGPDCEKVWPHIIDRVAEIKGGSYEQNRHTLNIGA